MTNRTVTGPVGGRADRSWSVGPRSEKAPCRVSLWSLQTSTVFFILEALTVHVAGELLCPDVLPSHLKILPLHPSSNGHAISP